MDTRFMCLLWTLHFLQCSGEISCKDKNGKPVDWFIVYKLPRKLKDTNPLIRGGVAHMYMDVNNQFFSLSTVSMNDTNQAVAYTLQQIYDNYKSKKVMYVMYNDQLPDGHTKPNRGHLKGDIAFDSKTGFWLVHSVPKFPPSANSRYVLPLNAAQNGQSLLCISMDASEFVSLGHEMLYNNPAVYDDHIPHSFRSEFAVWINVSDGQAVEELPWNKSIVLTSLGRQEFTVFAKYKRFDEDLYWYWVASALGDDLYVQTYRNSDRKLSSFCKGMYHVQNVDSMSFTNVLTFKRTVDHSKWAIGVHKKWTCIGDINRTKSQYKRAGGTVCVLIPLVWRAFNSAITDVEPCDKESWNNQLAIL